VLIEKATSATDAEEVERYGCEVCGKPLDECYSTITVTIDRDRAIRVYRFLFKKHYRYCSMAHAAEFFGSWPDLAEDYYKVAAVNPIIATETQ
jgi:hypothetical protein